MTPYMVAVGNSAIPGTISTHNANLKAALSQCPIPVWRPRDGRTSVYVFWEDAIMDAIALLGLKREELYELPPVCPTGESLTAHSYSFLVQRDEARGAARAGRRPRRALQREWAA